MLRQTTRQCRSALRACPSAVRRLATMPAESELRKTPLHANHVALGGKMVPFAGYELPVLYEREAGGVMKEHLHTRAPGCASRARSASRTCRRRSRACCTA